MEDNRYFLACLVELCVPCLWLAFGALRLFDKVEFGRWIISRNLEVAANNFFQMLGIGHLGIFREVRAYLMEVGYNPCLTWARCELVQAAANLKSIFSGVRPWGDFGMPELMKSLNCSFSLVTSCFSPRLKSALHGFMGFYFQDEG